MQTTLAMTLLLGSSAARAGASSLVVQPYLQLPAPDTVAVVWWTREPSPRDRLRFRPAEGGGWRTIRATEDWSEGLGWYRHEARVGGVEPDSRWRYRVRSGGRWWPSAEISGPPAVDGAVHIALLGDGRTDDDDILARHRRVMEQAADADLVVELGDTVALGDREPWRSYLTRVLSAGPTDPPGPGSHTPSIHVVGNHELASTPSPPPGDDAGDDVYYSAPDTAFARFQDVVVHPDNGSPDPRDAERYYAIERGPVSLIVLDLNNTSDDALDNHDLLADGSTPDWQPGSRQHAWLLRALERAEARSALTIVASHPSPVSSGVHGTDDPQIDQQRGYELRALLPTLLDHGVDAFISSHDHLAAAGIIAPRTDEDDTSPALDPQDPASMLFYVMGDSGAHSRPPDPRAASWMSPKEADPVRFTQTWLYDWFEQEDPQGAAHNSYVAVDVEPLGDGRFAATFAVVRTDGQRFAQTRIERRLPARAAAQDPAALRPATPPRR